MPTHALARIAATGIYLLHGIPRDVPRAARSRARREETTLRSVLVRALHKYTAGTWPLQAKSSPRMAIQREIQDFVQRHHGFVPKTSWIPHVKALRGSPMHWVTNRAGQDRRLALRPPDKREAIEQAFRCFGLI